MKRDSLLVDVFVVGFLLLLVAVHMAGCGSVTSTLTTDAGEAGGASGAAGAAGAAGQGGQLGGRGGGAGSVGGQAATDQGGNGGADVGGQGGAASGGTTGGGDAGAVGGTGGASCTPAVVEGMTCNCGGTCARCPHPDSYSTCPNGLINYSCKLGGDPFIGCARRSLQVDGGDVVAYCAPSCPTP